jgi:hypothetical protein
VIVGASQSGIEYIGGVAGYLRNYYLIDVSNGADLIIINPLEDNIDVEDIGGIVGYSSGSGYYNRVVNYGDIEGANGVAGILGGVGALPPSVGIIQFNQVANYGRIFGLSAVGGLIGNLDGSTGVDLNHVINHGVVLGLRNVGGLVGSFVINSQVGQASISNAFVFGQVFGLFSVGGAIGELVSFDGTHTHLSLENVLVYAEVENMFLGYLDEDFEINFNPFSFLGFHTGTIIGNRNIAALGNNVLSVSVNITKTQISDDGTGLFFLLDTTISGYYPTVGIGLGSGFSSIQEDEDTILLVALFVEQVVANSSLWVIEDNGLPFLEGFSIPESYTQFNREEKDNLFIDYLNRFLY